jgi:hypothetical protein
LSERKPNDTSFRPGMSGNPGGRAQTSEVSRLARRYTVDALRALVEVTRLPAHLHAAAKRAAARDLLDIAYPGLGKGGFNVEGNAVHLHLLAVQAMAGGATNYGREDESQNSAHSDEDADDGPQIDAEAWISTDKLLPEPDDLLPGEALPLWDVWKARKAAQNARDAEPVGENGAGTPDSAAESDPTPRDSSENPDPPGGKP